MRLKALLLVTVLGAAALPASAQAYRDCRQERGSNQAAGAILGGILGGVLGSNVAASGHRHDGTAVGAVLGGVVGSEIGRGGVDCRTAYGREPYPPAPYNNYPSAYGTSPGYAPPPDYGYYPEREYGDESQPYHRENSERRQDRRLYAKDSRYYNSEDEFAGRDCEEATQITRLPDGSEIRRPVEACRNAYYGDWHVKD
jgi:Glycine zipper 2TM domain